MCCVWCESVWAVGEAKWSSHCVDFETQDHKLNGWTARTNVWPKLSFFSMSAAAAV